MTLEIPKEGGPLYVRTWSLDWGEGQTVNDLIAASTKPISPDPIEVPEGLKGNLLVSSVDALANWGRKSAP